MPKRVFVARFESLPFNHWSSYIEMDKKHFSLFEITGQNPSYSYYTRTEGNPESTFEYIDSIEVGTVAARNVKEFQELAEKQEIRKHWNWHCQNWIVNLVKMLVKKKVVLPWTEDMEGLLELRESIEPKFDPDDPRVLDSEHEV